MKTSNHPIARKIFNVLLGITLAVALAACTKSPKERPYTNNNGSFYVDSLSGTESIDQNKMDPEYDIPLSKIYNFTACIKDNAKRNLIINHDFLIQGGTNETEASTNQTGCVTWSEEVDYNFFSDSKYVTLRRNVVSRGIQRGQDNIEIAINPWSNGLSIKSVIDVRNTAEIPNLVGIDESSLVLHGKASSTSSIKTGQLWVENIRTAIINSVSTNDKGHKINLELQLTPSIILKNLNDQPYYHNISKGNFTISTYLISLQTDSDGNESRQIFSTEFAEQTASVQNGLLKYNLSMTLPMLPTRGQVLLGLTLKPKDNTKSKIKISSFDGLFDFGRYNNIVGPHNSSPLKSNASGSDGNSFKLSSYVDLDNTYANIVMRYKESNGSIKLPQGWQQSKFEVKKMEIKFQNYGNISLPEQDVIFSVTACLANTFEGNLSFPGNELFTIHKIARNADGSRIKTTKKTLPDGCLTWNDSIHYKVYEKQHLFIESFILENSDFNINESLSVAINPWDYGFTFGRDARYLDEESSTYSQQNSSESELWLQSFAYNSIGYEYNIDDSMNLKVKRHYIFRIEPEVQMYHSLTAGRVMNPLYPGKYLLRLALQRNFSESTLNAGECISYVEKLVEVYRGRIITPISFEVDDIRLMGSRNNILIEIIPIYENKVITLTDGRIVPRESTTTFDQLIAWDSGLKSKTFVAPFTLIQENGSSGVLPVDLKSRLNSADLSNYFKKDPSGGFRELISRNNISGIERAPGYPAEIPATHSLSERASLDKNHSQPGTTVSEFMPSNISATELIKLTQNKKQQRTNMDNSLTEYLQISNLTLINMADNNSIRSFLYRLNNPLSYLKNHPQYQSFAPINNSHIEISFEQLRQSVKTGKLTKELANELCSFWFYDFIRQQVADRKIVFSSNSGFWGISNSENYIAPSAHKQFVDICRASAERDPRALFITARNYQVKKIDTAKFIGGTSHNLQLGTNINWNFTSAKDQSHAHTLAANAGVGFKFWDVVNIGGSYSESWSWSERKGTSDAISTNMNSGTGLKVQKTTFEIKFKEYEECFSIKLNPASFMNQQRLRNFESDSILVDNGWSGKISWESSITAEEKNKILSAGLYICSGETITTDNNLYREDYYYIAQDSAGADLQDPADIRNRPFTTLVRSKSDYYKFHQIINAQPLRPDGVTDPVAIKESPIDSLTTSFQNLPISFPGSYSISQ